MIVHEIKLNRRHLLRISKDTVNGTTFGQMRLWRSDPIDARFLPTPKGFGFDLTHLDDMIEGLLLLKALNPSSMVVS